MSMELIRWENQTVTAKHDSIQWDDGRNGILYGCNISHLGANKLRITSGFIVILGRLIEVSQMDINVNVASSGTLKGQLFIRMDLSSDNPIEVISEASSSLTNLTKETDANYTNGIYELQLCTYNISETTISNLVVTVPELAQLGDNMTAEDNLVFDFSYNASTGRYGYKDKEGNFIPFKSTLSGNATPDKVLKGVTFYSNDGDVKQTGTIESKAAETYELATEDRTIPAGKYLSGNQIIKGVKGGTLEKTYTTNGDEIVDVLNYDKVSILRNIGISEIKLVGYGDLADDNTPKRISIPSGYSRYILIAEAMGGYYTASGCGAVKLKDGGWNNYQSVFYLTSSGTVTLSGGTYTNGRGYFLLGIKVS